MIYRKVQKPSNNFSSKLISSLPIYHNILLYFKLILSHLILPRLSVQPSWLRATPHTLRAMGRTSPGYLTTLTSFSMALVPRTEAIGRFWSWVIFSYDRFWETLPRRINVFSLSLSLYSFLRSRSFVTQRSFHAIDKF